MNYKSDLHCHINGVSRCADLPLEEMIETYIKKGYSTMVVTDHFSPATFEIKRELSWSEKCEFYLSGYRRAKEIADGRINILLGMEYRNIYTSNDYLVYGVTEGFIKENNTSDDNNFISMHLKEFTELCHANGMLIYQAHPFRDGMTVIKPGRLDGIEVANCHVGHDSRNDIAMLWAEKYGYMVCGGSDCHHRGGEGLGGIITETEIKTNDDLLKALKGDVRLITMEE